MAQKICDKITELYELVDNKEDILLCMYRSEDGCVQRILEGYGINIVSFIAAVMATDPKFARIIEAAYDAYTACEMNKKLKNKEL